MSKEIYIGKIMREVAAAESKYPKFADHFMPAGFNPAPHLEDVRRLSDEHPEIALYTLCEEMLEAFDAYYKLDYEHCMQELAQCGNVILRMMEWVDNNHINKESK